MCLSLLHFQPCAGSEPDCNCCLCNKYTYKQLRSPEVTRVNFHLSDRYPLFLCLISCLRVYLVCTCYLCNKYTYKQLRSPEVTRVNFHLSDRYPLFLCLISCLRVYLVCTC